MQKKYKIEVDCANCALKMEEATKATEGVLNATVSFMTQKMTLEIADGADVEAILKQAVKCIKKVEPDCEVVVK